MSDGTHKSFQHRNSRSSDRQHDTGTKQESRTAPVSPSWSTASTSRPQLLGAASSVRTTSTKQCRSNTPNRVATFG